MTPAPSLAVASVPRRARRQGYESGKEPFPRLVTMVLTQDHLTDEHPETGYPFRESYMADNDLALARVMQTLSHSNRWPEMLASRKSLPEGARDNMAVPRV